VIYDSAVSRRKTWTDGGRERRGRLAATEVGDLGSVLNAVGIALSTRSLHGECQYSGSAEGREEWVPKTYAFMVLSLVSVPVVSLRSLPRAFVDHSECQQTRLRCGFSDCMTDMVRREVVVREGGSARSNQGIDSIALSETQEPDWTRA
jgi:hypothetical protein